MKRLSFLSLLLLACACSHQTAEPVAASLYDEPSYWYDNGKNVDEQLADVFYILPTCVHDWTDSTGVVQHYASLTDSLQRANMLPSYQLADDIFADSANFFAPYYRHISLESWMEGEDVINQRFVSAMDDIAEAFAYYLKHWNNGRRFVLAGFSQGGKCVVELLKKMDDETASRLVAAYVCGYKVTAADTLATTHLRPARCADDTGVTIVYNTVCDTMGISNTLGAGNLYICNPASWTQDADPHPLNDSVSIRIDTTHNVLIADGIDAEKAFIPRFAVLFPKGNLHLQELTLYHDQLQANIKQRIAASTGGRQSPCDTNR